MKIIPKPRPQDPNEVNLNDLGGGVIFLYQGCLYIKNSLDCGGTDLSTGDYEKLDDAWVIAVDATLTWQRKKKKKKK